MVFLVDTPHLHFTLSIFQENEHQENFSHWCSIAVVHHLVEGATL
jgi:hypothetical protein